MHVNWRYNPIHICGFMLRTPRSCSYTWPTIQRYFGLAAATDNPQRLHHRWQTFSTLVSWKNILMRRAAGPQQLHPPRVRPILMRQLPQAPLKLILAFRRVPWRWVKLPVETIKHVAQKIVLPCYYGRFLVFFIFTLDPILEFLVVHLTYPCPAELFPHLGPGYWRRRCGQPLGAFDLIRPSANINWSQRSRDAEPTPRTGGVCYRDIPRGQSATCTPTTPYGS